jgi:hypothetical protein
VLKVYASYRLTFVQELLTCAQGHSYAMLFSSPVNTNVRGEDCLKVKKITTTNTKWWQTLKVYASYRLTFVQKLLKCAQSIC